MKKYGKKYQAALKKVDAAKIYDLAEAVKLVKETAITKLAPSAFHTALVRPRRSLP